MIKIEDTERKIKIYKFIQGIKMNILRKIYIELFHLKIQMIGHKGLKTDGYAVLPCRKCGFDFTSRTKHNNYYYCWCNECRKDGID